jgi:hypothetical protein
MLLNDGAAIMVKIAMIATTTMTSTNVNPRNFFIVLFWLTTLEIPPLTDKWQAGGD